MAVSWLLCLVMGGLLVVGLVGLLLLRRGKAGVTQPACGKCGYAVAGLPTFTCPECGSDLRAVGIVMPKSDHGLRRVAWAVLWTILLPLPMLLIARLGLQVGLPMVGTNADTVTLTAPTSGAYQSVTIAASGSGPVRSTSRAGTVPVQTVTLQLLGIREEASPLTLDAGTLTSRWTPSQGPSRQGPLTTQVLGEWMASVGVDPNDAEVQQEIGHLVGLIRSAASGSPLSGDTGGMFRHVNQSSNSSATPAPSAKAIVLLFFVFWFVLWVAGLWRCLRRKTAPPPVATATGGTS